MKLNDYQTEAYKLAMYPKQYKSVYPMLKLMGELGELREVLVSEDYSVDDLIKEAGDVLWYVAALATDQNLKLQQIIYPVYMPHHDYNDAVNTAMQLCETLGKQIRDGKISDERHEAIPHQLARIAMGVFATCHNLHSIKAVDILTTNLEKLTSRKERGKLSGDGDNR